MQFGEVKHPPDQTGMSSGFTKEMLNPVPIAIGMSKDQHDHDKGFE